MQIYAFLGRDLGIPLRVLADVVEREGFCSRGRRFGRWPDVGRGSRRSGLFFAPETETGERSLGFLRLGRSVRSGACAKGCEGCAGVVFAQAVPEAVLAVAGLAAHSHGRKRIDVRFALGMRALLSGC